MKANPPGWTRLPLSNAITWHVGRAFPEGVSVRIWVDAMAYGEFVVSGSAGAPGEEASTCQIGCVETLNEAVSLAIEECLAWERHHISVKRNELVGCVADRFMVMRQSPPILHTISDRRLTTTRYSLP